MALLFLCGCSNKLLCTYKIGYDDIEINNKIVFDFKTQTLKQVDKMIFEDSISAAKYYDEIEEYKDDYNLVLNKNIIVSEISDIIKIDGDKDKIKKQYESYGYNCK